MSAVIVALSLSGHAAGSAMLPSLPGLLVALALVLALTSTIRAGASPARLFAILLGAQALLHVVFVLSSHGETGTMSVLPSLVSILGHVGASLIAVAVLRLGDQVLSSWTALLTAAFGSPRPILPAVPGRPALPVPAWDAHSHSADTHLLAQVRRGPPLG